MQLARRAELSPPEVLASTFVDVGPLFTLLSTVDGQVLYGRRGTGKTHALYYLQQQRLQAGDICLYVDLRSIGSNLGLYADGSVPLADRATRLLLDVLNTVHDQLLSAVVADAAERFDLSKLGPLLDALATEITSVSIVGTVEQEETAAGQRESESSSSGGISIAPEPSFSANFGTSRRTATTHGNRRTTSGTEQYHVSFGGVGSLLKEITTHLDGARVWLLLDEWSSVPSALQPYLADFLKRGVLPVRGITVKIAAIEARTRFKIDGTNGDYVGIEVGADIAADLNLDDYMVFDNDSERATRFFASLFTKHVEALESPPGVGLPNDPDEMVRLGFTQKDTFQELVRAAEGVPRDAINVLSICAQRALNDKISKPVVRQAAQKWYERDKKAAITNTDAQFLLNWIWDEVIGTKRARAFLLRTDRRVELVDRLFDARVLHILKRSISGKDGSGVRYDVYKLDYGCYVDLLHTNQSPNDDRQMTLLLLDEDVNHVADDVEVPADDYRAIRRAILAPDAALAAMRLRNARRGD